MAQAGLKEVGEGPRVPLHSTKRVSTQVIKEQLAEETEEEQKAPMGVIYLPDQSDQPV